jgi:hypothetical protein
MTSCIVDILDYLCFHHKSNQYPFNTRPFRPSVRHVLSTAIASHATHMTHNLRHIDLTDSWIKAKVADGTCVLVKVDSVNNNSDLGTKRVSQSLFNALTHPLVDRQLRDNL